MSLETFGFTGWQIIGIASHIGGVYAAWWVFTNRIGPEIKADAKGKKQQLRAYLKLSIDDAKAYVRIESR